MAVNSPPGSPKGIKEENGNTERGRSPGGKGKANRNSSPRSKSPPKPSKHVPLPSNDTNSIDPESVRCRVFVGNLNTDKAGQEELVKHFSEFGEVVGCSIHTNFGFVQYANKDEADKAVAKTHGTFLFGKRVDVNIASDRRKPQSKDRRRGDDSMNRPRRRSRSRSQERCRSRSPLSKYDELYGKNDPLARRGDRHHPRDYYDEHRGDYFDNPEPYGRQRDTFARDNYGPSSTKTADCEIIAMSGDLRTYADSIQSRLQAMGIVASVMFPPPGVSVLRIVDNISRSGSLYAVVITSQNMYHKSCTLNILHGAPQEHRNMPLDDALAFVARNFNQHLSESRDGRSNTHQPAPPLVNRSESMEKTILTQDPYISGLLNMAAGGKPLKVVEVNHLIEALIKYKNEIDSSSGIRVVSNQSVRSRKICKDTALSVVDVSLPPSGPVGAAPYRRDQERHPGHAMSQSQDVLSSHSLASQSYFRPQQTAYSYGSTASSRADYTGYPDHRSLSSSTAGTSGNYDPVSNQKSTGYPSSSIDHQSSAYPNYYN